MRVLRTEIVGRPRPHTGESILTFLRISGGASFKARFLGHITDLTHQNLWGCCPGNCPVSKYQVTGISLTLESYRLQGEVGSGKTRVHKPKMPTLGGSKDLKQRLRKSSSKRKVKGVKVIEPESSIRVSIYFLDPSGISLGNHHHHPLQSCLCSY